MLSYLISPYKNTELANHWIQNYWKLIVFYFLVTYSIEDIKDLFVICAGFVVILFIYQLHSWLDFLRGGSYVWQQGIKRIVGIWTSGVGSANAFGMICLFGIPFGYSWLKGTKSKKIKITLIFFLILSFLSIAFSGTRGAMLGVLFFVLINMRGWKQIILSVLILIIITISIWIVFPDYLKDRFLGLVVEKNEQVITRIDEIQKESAMGRIEGLIDGWNLVKLRPLFGYGPGSSPEARKIVNERLLFNYESDFQLHNLYGQILAEAGFGGTIIFLFILLVYFLRLKNLNVIIQLNPDIYQYKLALLNGMFVFLFYGMVSHTLYRFHWFFLFALNDGLHYVIPKYIQKNLINYNSLK
ncbi:MAG: O-antigen ligase family protein [Candidatus Helarchaeota archaeon]